jgi:hypothetical protein
MLIKLEFSPNTFLIIHTYKNFMKIRPVGAELFHADRPREQRDTTKLIVAFRNFAKAPKIVEFGNYVRSNYVKMVSSSRRSGSSVNSS